MSLISEYINRKLSIPELESEIMKLISNYNKLRNTYLFVYAAAIEKQIPGVPVGEFTSRRGQGGAGRVL